MSSSIWRGLCDQISSSLAFTKAREKSRNLGHQLLLPPTDWCPMFASRTMHSERCGRAAKDGEKMDEKMDHTHLKGRRMDEREQRENG